MKLSYTTQTLAKTRADKIHADMIAFDPSYAEGTIKWITPYLENGKWHVDVTIRCKPVLTQAEISNAWNA